MRNTIKITNEAKESLDWLKSNFSFTNFSIAIETASTFFKNNNINPREVMINNFSNSIFKLEKELSLKMENILEIENKNTERIIKLNRRIEEDILKPVNKKINDIHVSVLNDYNNIHNEKVLKSNDENVSDKALIDNISELKKIIDQQNKSISGYKDLVEKHESENKEYFRCMKTLNQNMKVENTPSGKKIYINLPVDEAENLFHLIP